MTELVTSSTNQPTIQNSVTADLVQRWLKFADVSEKSVITYNTALKQLFRYFDAIGITQPTRENLIDWRDGLISQKRSASTIQLYVTSAKLFFRWLADEGIYPNIADHLKSNVKITHEHKKDALSATEGGNLLKAVKGDSELAKRNRAIIALMLTAGLRTIELERADVGDIVELQGKHYLKIQGKGHDEKDDSVLIATQVYELIQDYLSCRSDVKDVSPLFTATARRCKGARLSTQTIRKMTKGYLREIGLGDKRHSAHALRHSAITQIILEMRKTGKVDYTLAQQVARHVDISTTMIYVKKVERLENNAEQTAADAFFANV